MIFAEERRNELRLAAESFGKQTPEEKAIQLVYTARMTNDTSELKNIAKKLHTTVEKLAYKAYDQRMTAWKHGARPVSGVKNDMKAEMAALVGSAKALGLMGVLKKVAMKHSPKKK